MQPEKWAVLKVRIKNLEFVAHLFWLSTAISSAISVNNLTVKWNERLVYQFYDASFNTLHINRDTNMIVNSSRNRNMKIHITINISIIIYTNININLKVITTTIVYLSYKHQVAARWTMTYVIYLAQRRLCMSWRLY